VIHELVLRLWISLQLRQQGRGLVERSPLGGSGVLLQLFQLLLRIGHRERRVLEAARTLGGLAEGFAERLGGPVHAPDHERSPGDIPERGSPEILPEVVQELGIEPRRLADVIAESVSDENGIGRGGRCRALDQGVEFIRVLELSVLFEHQRTEVEAFDGLH
jgi:hypothetical protein